MGSVDFFYLVFFRWVAGLVRMVFSSFGFKRSRCAFEKRTNRDIPSANTEAHSTPKKEGPQSKSTELASPCMASATAVLAQKNMTHDESGNYLNKEHSSLINALNFGEHQRWHPQLRCRGFGVIMR